MHPVTRARAALGALPQNTAAAAARPRMRPLDPALLMLGGCAIGLERFVAQRVGAANVREVTAFPRDINRLTP